jgi:hypothetical protein
MIAMNHYTRIISAFAAIAAIFATAPFAAASTPDRIYRMGDDSFEGAVTDGSVSTTFDSQGVTGQAQLIDLTAVNTPTYRSINALGRPDGGTGRAIEFNAAQEEYLHGLNLNSPDESVSHTSVSPQATLNYYTIFDRGLEFWVRPTSTAVQTLVMDSNQHGVRIDSAGKFSVRYAGSDFQSPTPAVANTWYHIEVVRPATFANGSRMYVNGVAVAAAPGSYNSDASHLTVGANTAGTAASFTGGTNEFFSGIIDDLELFVIGSAPACGAAEGCPNNRPAANYGTFNFPTDNAFADFKLTGVAGDLDHNTFVDDADKDAFVGGWMKSKVIAGFQIGDLETYQQGDLNFDGITNIFDLALMQTALAEAGAGGITEADLFGVSAPEPASLALLLAPLVAAACARRKRN